MSNITPQYAPYRFSSTPAEPMLGSVEKMTNEQLERAASDPWNVYQELARREQRLREALGRTAEEVRS